MLDSSMFKCATDELFLSWITPSKCVIEQDEQEAFERGDSVLF